VGVEIRPRWWNRIPRRYWRIVIVIDSADDVPIRLPSHGAALVGTSLRPKWLVFDCPCQRDHRTMVNLDIQRRPTWSVLKRRRLTIMPSIDDYSIDRCHFFIRRGKINWVNDSREVQDD